MLVHFRKRINVELVNKINQAIVKRQQEKTEVKIKKKDSPQEQREKPPNQGKLILNATCAPADIRYPTDLGILNQARRESEKIIDRLFYCLKGKLIEKPRTCRQIAKKEYLKVPKKRKQNVSEEEKKQATDDERFRNAIEGKFGQAKRRFSLNLVMTKLPETSETSIAITFLVVNLSRLVRQFLPLFLFLFLDYKTDELKKPFCIKRNYVYTYLIEVKIITNRENYRLLAA